MKFFPIIPVWIMIPICVVILILKRKKTSDFIRQIIIVILLFIINLRPMIKSSNVKTQTNNLDILFVIDTTISMMAEDMQEKENRLEAVKSDCEYIINEFSGSRFSLITFNNEAQIIFPFSYDINLAKNTIQSIRTLAELYSHGSTLNTPIEKMKSILSKTNDEGRAKIVFFISDGEITNEDKLKSFSELKKYVSDGAVLGYGTTSGGRMQVEDTLEEGYTYLQDKSSYPYQFAVSKLDENNLKSIAKDLDIEYINMQKQSDIKNKIRSIKSGATPKSGENTIDSYDDIYFVFVVPLVGLLIFEFINFKRRL